MKACRRALALIAATLAMTSVPAAMRADAVLLVNSQSASYADAQREIRPYLDNFGVPYTVLDIATTPVTATIGDYALIIVGHRQLDVSHLYLDAAEEGYIAQAVHDGTGLVNFDNDLSSNNVTSRYQFIQSVFGFGYAAPTSVSGVTFPSDAASTYVTSRHAGGEVLSTAPMASGGITLPATAHALVTTSSPATPFLAAATYGSGRAIQWASYDWIDPDVKGPMAGLDDLVWRSFVWSARKPFAMQGLPNILTMRIDDAFGAFWYVHTANQLGLKPWLGLYYQSVSDTDAADLSSLVHGGNATASVHAESNDNWFYWDHYGAQNWPDATMNAKFDAATAWHTAHDVPISKFVLGHYYELGTNVFAGLQGWGVEFLGLSQNPGDGFDAGGRWIMQAPYRLYEDPSYANRALPMYYADMLTVSDPNPPHTQRSFFNCITEIRDDAGYEWYPDNDVSGTVGRGTRQVKRAFDSMALATLFTHEQHIVPISPSNWSQELQGIMANLAPYNPRVMTMDDACRYVRATYTSNIGSAVYDPATHNLNASLTGSADVPTQFYAFTDRDGAIVETLVDVPAFTGSTQVSHQIAGALHHILVSPVTTVVPVGGSRPFTAQGFDASDNPILGLGVSWLAAAGGSIDGRGVFTAGSTPGLFTNAVAASNSGVTGFATVQVYTPVVDHFAIDPIAGSIQAGSPFGIRITAYDQYGQIITSYSGSALLGDTTGTIVPSSTGAFTAGVWTGNVTIGISATGMTITATSGNGQGVSNPFDVSAAQSASIAFSCADDSHQIPVLPTTSNVNALNENDGQWTEFFYGDCRNYASVFAGIDEELYGLPPMDFYYAGLPNGQYRVTAKLYTSATLGRDLRYFYGFQSSAPKALSVDVSGGSGGCEQHANYDLGTVSVTNNRFDIYVQDADLLPTATSSYPFFGWAAIRLDCVNQTWYRDADGDGYGNPLMPGQACTAPAGYVANAADCDDSNPAIHPGAADTNCNGIDENCSGQADEGYAPVATACGLGACAAAGITSCVNGVLYDSCTPGAPTPEICDGIDNDCDGVVDNGAGAIWYRDADGDGYGNPSVTAYACSAPAGYVATAGDCNDASSAVHPGAAEVCDGLDNDCDGAVDNGVGPIWYRDADGDGFGNPAASLQACSQPAGYVANSNDCNDADAAIHPGAPDANCNGIDENCNGQADEGYAPVATACGVGACAATGMTSCVNGVLYDSCTPGTPTPEICDGIDNDCDGLVDVGLGSTWYRDADGDGYGDPNVTIKACSQPAGYVDRGTDCDDTNPNVHPGGDDSTCNGIDENCNGTADEDYVSVEATCGVGACASTGMTSCVAGVVQSTCVPGSPTPEVCDGIDNNCDGSIDNGVGPIWYRDADGDGFGNPAASLQACAKPAGYVANAGDCNDANAGVHPGAADDTCNGIDENCNGQADEGYVPSGTTCGVGACARTGVTSCVLGVVHDSCAAGLPTAETCDGIDNDCDGVVDNGVLLTWYRDADGDGHGVASDAVVACAPPSGYVAAAGDCNDNDAQAFGLPTDVAGLSLVKQADGVHLTWTSQAATAGAGTTYDLVTGAVSELRSDGGFARAACLSSGSQAAGYVDPGSPSGVYYLARAKNSCGNGTFGLGSPSPDSRAALAAAPPCP